MRISRKCLCSPFHNLPLFIVLAKEFVLWNPILQFQQDASLNGFCGLLHYDLFTSIISLMCLWLYSSARMKAETIFYSNLQKVKFHSNVSQNFEAIRVLQWNEMWCFEIKYSFVNVSKVKTYLSNSSWEGLPSGWTGREVEIDKLIIKISFNAHIWWFLFHVFLFALLSCSVWGARFPCHHQNYCSGLGFFINKILNS